MNHTIVSVTKSPQLWIHRSWWTFTVDVSFIMCWHFLDSFSDIGGSLAQLWNETDQVPIPAPSQAVCPWASFWISLSFIFLICNNKVITSPSVGLRIKWNGSHWVPNTVWLLVNSQFKLVVLWRPISGNLTGALMWWPWLDRVRFENNLTGLNKAGHNGSTVWVTFPERI